MSKIDQMGLKVDKPSLELQRKAEVRNDIRGMCQSMRVQSWDCLNALTVPSTKRRAMSSVRLADRAFVVNLIYHRRCTARSFKAKMSWYSNCSALSQLSNIKCMSVKSHSNNFLNYYKRVTSGILILILPFLAKNK